MGCIDMNTIMSRIAQYNMYSDNTQPLVVGSMYTLTNEFTPEVILQTCNFGFDMRAICTYYQCTKSYRQP